MQTISAATATFRGYVKSFYGAGGVYDMGATDQQIAEATTLYVGDLLRRDDITWGGGDSLDRERVRDILINQFGLKFPN